MNIYSTNIRVYRDKTAHLEPIEDLAYRRLIELYYKTEVPLQGSADDIARLVRLKPHTAVVEQILEEFFELGSKGYELTWADDKISKYTKMLEDKKQAGIASAEARRKKAQRQKTKQQKT